MENYFTKKRFKLIPISCGYINDIIKKAYALKDFSSYKVTARGYDVKD